MRITVALLLLFASPLSAQDPFGGGQPVAGPAAAAKPPDEVKITSPLVQALLDTRPSTPSDWVKTISTLIDLKHAAVGRQFVNQLLAANLSEDQLAALERELGSDPFLKMAGAPELAPEAQQFVEAVMVAAKKQAEDPARLEQFVAQLQDPSPAARNRAIAELRRGNSAAVLALIAVLADENRANEHAIVRDALVVLRASSLSPLTAALESESSVLKTHVVGVLRRSGTADPAIHLLGPAHSPRSPPELKRAASNGLTQLLGYVPDVQSAANTLYGRARTEYDRSVLIRDEVGPRSVWRWDAAAGLPAEKQYPVFMVSLLEAKRLSKDLYELLPDSPLARRLYLGSLLELAVHEAALDEPLPTGPGTPHDVAAAFGPAALQDVLAHSMATGHVAAASAAARILGEIGRADLLYTYGAATSVLAEATMHPDRRLRYAAVAAIMSLKPDRPYPGSSQVLSAAVHFAGSTGHRRALVLDTHLQEATRLGSLLRQMGYDEVDSVTQPRDFLERAAAWPDYELALIDFNLPRTNVDELLQMLRHDHRSRSLPVLYVTDTTDDQRSARYVAERNSSHHAPRDEMRLVQYSAYSTGVIVRPPDLEGMQVQVNNFMAGAGVDLLPPTLRLEHAKQSLRWLGAMAQQRPPLYNVQRAAKTAEMALAFPDLTPLAAPLLADLGTAGSQQALLRIVNRPSETLELRQAGAQAFRHSVHRHGILLTSFEMLQQYDRYNASEMEPPESQEVLASILDTLEGHRRGGRETRPAGTAP